MKPQDIIAFRTLVKLQNFSRAAEELFMSQPTLSKKIQNLEEELGAILLVRGKGKLKLTSAGVVFYEQSREILEVEQKIISSVKNVSEDKRQTFSIGFMGQGIARLYSDVLNKIKEQYPNVKIEVTLLNYSEISPALDKGMIDLAVVADLGFSTMKSFKCECFFKSENVLLFPECHPFVLEKKKDFSSLACEKFIVLEESISPRGLETIQTLCRDCGFTPNIVKQVNHIEDILFYVEAGQGISILPQFDCTSTYRISTVELPSKELRAPIHVISAYDRKNTNPFISIFRKLIAEKNVCV